MTKARSHLTEAATVRMFVETFATCLRNAANEIEKQQFTMLADLRATRGLPEEERCARLAQSMQRAIAASNEKINPDISELLSRASQQR